MVHSRRRRQSNGVVMRQLSVAVTTTTAHKDDGSTTTTTTGRDTLAVSPRLACTAPRRATSRRPAPRRAASRHAAPRCAAPRRALFALQHSRPTALLQLGHDGQPLPPNNTTADKMQFVCFVKELATVCCPLSRDRAALQINIEKLVELNTRGISDNGNRYLSPQSATVTVKLYTLVQEIVLNAFVI